MSAPRPRPSWVGLLLLAIAPAAHAERPEAASLVAPEAPLYVEVLRPNDAVDRLTAGRFPALLKAAPVYEQAIEGEPFRHLRAVVDLVADRLGMPWPQAVRELTGNGLILAVEKPDRALVIATPSEPATLAKAHAILLDLARQDAAGKGQPDPVREVEHRKVAVFLAGSKGEAHAILDGRLVLASTRDELEAAIDRSLDKAPSLADDALWKARRAAVETTATAWAFARLDRLRALDPKKFGGDGKPAPPPLQFLLGAWVETLQKAPWASASLNWEEDRLAAELTLPTPPGGYSAAGKSILPPKDSRARAILLPPRTIASVSLWRDLSAIWDVRTDLFPPGVVQDLAKLDAVAGQFFGGRDFGTGVLGALASDWRLVVAAQDEKDLDPKPEARLPAFALVVGLKPDDEEFARSLRVAYQSFIGLANLGAAQKKAPPLEMGTETVEGVSLATSRYITPKAGKAPAGPVHQRHNFSPSSAQVDDTFLLSSSVGLARDLIHALKAKPPASTEATLVMQAEGATLAGVLEANRTTLVAKNMLDKGNDKAKADAEVSYLLTLLRTLNHATLNARDQEESVKVRLSFDLGKP